MKFCITRGAKKEQWSGKLQSRLNDIFFRVIQSGRIVTILLKFLINLSKNYKLTPGFYNSAIKFSRPV